MGGINIIGGFGFNVGKAEIEYFSGAGAFDAARNTGAIVGERARHVTWKGFKIHNTSSYGQIGSIWRGTGFHINIEGEFMGGTLYAAADGSTDEALLPIGGGTPLPAGLSMNSRGINHKLRIVGDLSYLYRCETPTGTSTGHSGHTVEVMFSSNPTVGMVLVPSARSDAYLTAYNYNNGTLYSGSFNQIVGDGNAMPAAGTTTQSFNNLMIAGSMTIEDVLTANGATTFTDEVTMNGATARISATNVLMQSLAATTGTIDELVKQNSPDLVNYDYVMIRKT